MPAGPAADGHCTPGTLVTRDDIFAYQLGTGTIDPNFAPVLDQGPVYTVIAGPDNTVYVGGSFTTVNGVSEPGLVQLSVTPGQPTDGQVVPGFAAPLSGTVHALALGGNALYVGGNFRTLIRRASRRRRALPGWTPPPGPRTVLSRSPSATRSPGTRSRSSTCR